MKTKYGSETGSHARTQCRPEIAPLSGGTDGLSIEYGFAESPFGICFVAATSEGICALQFIDIGDECGAGTEGNGMGTSGDFGKGCSRHDFKRAAQAVIAGFLEEWPGVLPLRNDTLAVRLIASIFGPAAESGPTKGNFKRSGTKENAVSGDSAPEDNVAGNSTTANSTAPAKKNEVLSGPATSGAILSGELLSGIDNDLPLKLHLRGTPFQLKIWNTLLDIPFGGVASYGQIASRAGCPKAVRAAASAIARNPVAYIIPCHRVIRSAGAVGQYRWRPERKAALLRWEGSK